MGEIPLGKMTITYLPSTKRTDGSGGYLTRYPARSSKPYVTPIFYQTQGLLWKDSRGTYYPPGYHASPPTLINGGSASDEHPRNKEAEALAYDRIVSQIRGADTASWGETCAEWEQAVDMITGAANKIGRSWSQLKSGNIPGFLREVGFVFGRRKKQPTWTRYYKGQWLSLRHKKVLADMQAFKRGLKNFASLLLEYDFGWVPLTSDITSGLNTLITVPAPDLRTRFRGSAKLNAQIGESYPKPYLEFWGLQADFGVQYIADVSVSNRLAAKLNLLGLNNPLSVLWAITPLSFIADWFLDIQKTLDSLTHLHGFSVKNVQVTHRRTESYHRTADHQYDQSTQSGKAFFFRRRILTSLPTPGLFQRKWGKGFAAGNRARDAIAMLIGFLK